MVRIAAKRHRFRVLGVLISLTFLVAIVRHILLGGVSAAEDRASAFLLALDRADYALAYEYLDPEWRKLQSSDEFAGFLQSVRKTLGPCEERIWQDSRLTLSEAAREVSVVYAAKCEEARVTVYLTLRRREGAWRIRNLDYRSPSPRDARGRDGGNLYETILEDLETRVRSSAESQPSRE